MYVGSFLITIQPGRACFRSLITWGWNFRSRTIVNSKKTKTKRDILSPSIIVVANLARGQKLIGMAGFTKEYVVFAKKGKALVSFYKGSLLN